MGSETPLGVSAGVQDTLQGCFLAWPLSIVIPGQPLAFKWGTDALPGLVPGSCLLLGLRGHLQLIPHSKARENHLSFSFPMPLCCLQQDCKQCESMDDAQTMPCSLFLTQCTRYPSLGHLGRG